MSAWRGWTGGLCYMSFGWKKNKNKKSDEKYCQNHQYRRYRRFRHLSLSTWWLSTTRTVGRKAGAINWTNDESLAILDVMERILPIGPNEWQQVVEHHLFNRPPGRDINSIRRKYMSLHRRYIPTGDPNIPPAAKQAKWIKIRPFFIKRVSIEYWSK